MLDRYIKKNSDGLYEIYDRFSFDNLFRLLLNNEYDHEEALNFILDNCALSALVFQERTHNKYYLKISVEDAISPDLIALRNQYLLEIMADWHTDLEEMVASVAALIRECSPKEIADWKKFYQEKLKEFLKEKGIDLTPAEYLESLGKALYVKISEVMQSEIEEIREEDCIEFIKNLVINRTYDGYVTEKQTVYGQLQEILGIKIEPAPDEWDRLYNVDFFIKIGDKYMGLQIKPVTFEHAPEYASKWKEAYKESHEKFTKKFGGKVFVILSVKKGDKKVIFNAEIIDEIKEEIKRLQNK